MDRRNNSSRESVPKPPIGDVILLHQCSSGVCHYCEKPMDDWIGTFEPCPARYEVSNKE